MRYVRLFVVLAAFVGSLFAQLESTGSVHLPTVGVQAVSAQAFSPLVEQWRPTVVAACDRYGCDPNYLLSIIACESRGVEYPPPNVNPNGGLDRGLLQINDVTWGNVAYEDGVNQIWWAAAHLGSVWWACG